MVQQSKSWLELKPQKIINDLKEDFEEYYQCLQQNEKLQHIPKEVLEHWIYDQYYSERTIRHYAWLNFYQIKFEKVKWPTKRFVGIEIIDSYHEYVQFKSELGKISDFQYDYYWKKNGTWFIPPIVLDVSSLKQKIPRISGIKGPFQFVDGHTRLGYLYALINIARKKKTNLDDSHWIYLMQQE